jgi:uncharacterized protein
MVPPLMPKATAVWLLENTSLTFAQIANFCGMHLLEVKGIADGEVAQGIMGIDPVENAQLTKEEITRCEQNSTYVLALSKKAQYHVDHTRKKSTRYTPIARRHEKPDAVAWLIKNCPGITDLQIVKLIGTTKTTIASIRGKTHWNMQHIRPRDPVLLGLSTQEDLDKVIKKIYLANKVAQQQDDKIASSNA